MSAEIIDLSEQRERRRYIALAHASDDWQQIKASMAISGFELTDDNAERIGRMIDASVQSSMKVSQLAVDFQSTRIVLAE